MLHYNTAMHEWALAEAVIESVKKEVEKRNLLTIESVVLSLGTLQNVDEGIFREGLVHFLDETIPLSIDNIRFKNEDAAFRCRKCGASWDLKKEDEVSEDDLESIHFLPESAHSIISCPSCGSPDFEIVKGRGVYIEEIIAREME